MGPPGCRKKEKALTLADYFNFSSVMVGDLLQKEIIKKSDYGKKIAEAKEKNAYAEDELVMELVNNQIKEWEKEGKSYIIEGYPRTRVQALGLQRMNIIPDKFFILNSEEENKAKPDAPRPILEYKLNIKEVKQIFSGFYCEIDANKEHEKVVDDMARIMKLKIRPNAPRRPPRVLLVGPCGSGKSTVGKILAAKYGLIYVSAANLLNAEISQKSEAGKIAAQKIPEGELVPDDLITKLVEERLNASDCKVNGWILDGFPKTENQMHMLKSMKLSPSLVVVLQIDDDLVYERHEFKKIDPITGIVYNLKNSVLKDEEILNRLVTRECDNLEIVKKRLKTWKEFLPKLEEAYNERRISLSADKSVESIVDSISEAIENPTF